MKPPQPGTFRTPFSILLSKELRETYRDKRTIVTLVVMPLLLYPIISLLAYNFLPKPKLDSKPEGFRIVFGSADAYDYLFPKIEAGHKNLIRQEQSTQDLPPFPKSTKEPKQNKNQDIVDQFQAAASIPIEKIPLDDHDWISAHPSETDKMWLESGRADAVIRFQPDSRKILLSYNPDNSYSVRAYQFVSKRLQSADLLRAEILSKRAGYRLPLSKTETQLIRAPKKPGINFAALVPLILIMMTITGAVYPAIDLTAGERERGTLETLIASPISKTRMLGAKFLAVWSVAMMTALVNIASLSITLWVFQLDAQLLGPAGLTIGLVVKVFLLLGLFALFFSAILLLLTSFAQSFKEAQAYLVPLMVFSLAPAMAGLSPSVQLTNMVALAPMVNLVLLTRDLIQGIAQPLPATISVLSSFLYAAAVLSLASKTFGSDAVLYGTGSWKDMFAKKSEDSVPSPSFAFTILAVMFPVQFVLLGVMGRSLTSLSATSQVLSVAAGTAFIFLLTPLVFILAGKFRLAHCFGFRWPGLTAIVAAAILGLSLWPVTGAAMWMIGSIASWMHPSESQSWITSISALASKQVESWSAVPSWILILCLAVTPAVCEELFFRGILFRSLSKREERNSECTDSNWKWFPILVTAVAFGLFHFITESSVAPLRFFITTSLGIVLGWVAYQTQSVLPGIVLHAINNSILLQIAIWKHQNLSKSVLPETSYWTMIGIGLLILLMIAIGFWLVTKSRPLSKINSKTATAAAALILCLSFSHQSTLGQGDHGPKPDDLPTIAKGWKISRFANRNLVHDLHIMAIGPKDEIFVAGPKQLFQLVDSNQDGTADKRIPVGFQPKGSPQGMSVSEKWIHIVCDGGIWRISRLTDQPPKRVLSLPKTGGEHHFHAIKQAENPDEFYFIAGNYSGIDGLPVAATSPIQKPKFGVVGKWNLKTRKHEIFVDGIRNAYDFDRDQDGNWLIYDSDDERESGLPWYRPTTLFQAATGTDIGWRSRCLKLQDSFGLATPIAETGRGSPTGVAVQRTKNWRQEFSGAIVFADWTFGRIYLKTNAVESKETILAQSSPSTGFAVTSLAFDSKGDLWVSTGGRGTEGAVYRIYKDAATSDDSQVISKSNAADNKDDQIEANRTIILDLAMQKELLQIPPPANRFTTKDRNRFLAKAFQLSGRFGHRVSQKERDLFSVRFCRAFVADLKEISSIKNIHTLTAICNDWRTGFYHLYQLQPSNDSITDPWDFLKTKVKPNFSRQQKAEIQNDWVKLTRLANSEAKAANRVSFLFALAKLQLVSNAVEESNHTLLKLGKELEKNGRFENWVEWLSLVAVTPQSKSGSSDNQIEKSQLVKMAGRILAEFDLRMKKGNVRSDRQWEKRIRSIVAMTIYAFPSIKKELATNQQWKRLDQVRILRIFPFSLQRRILNQWLANSKNWNLNKPHSQLISFLRNWSTNFRAQNPDSEQSKTLLQVQKILQQQTTAEQNLRKKLLLSGKNSLDSESPGPEANKVWNERAESLLKSVAWDQGKPEQGKLLYKNTQCQSCHDEKIVDSPDLAGITGRFSRKDILVAILNPHKDVSNRYQQTVIQLEDGQVVVGKEIYSSSHAIVLKDTEGKVRNIDQAEVDVMKKSNLSSMPSGLMQKATDKQWADLMAYLQKM